MKIILGDPFRNPPTGAEKNDEKLMKNWKKKFRELLKFDNLVFVEIAKLPWPGQDNN